MTEKNPKIVDFGAKRKEEINKGKRAGIETSPDGESFLFPQEQLELTEAEALDIARKILETFPTRESVVAEFKRREQPREEMYNLTFDPNLKESIEERVDASLKSQKEYAGATTTEGLVRMLQIHKNNPEQYYPTLLVAIAEEILGRFPSAKSES